MKWMFTLAREPGGLDEGTVVSLGGKINLPQTTQYHQPRLTTLQILHGKSAWQADSHPVRGCPLPLGSQNLPSPGRHPCTNGRLDPTTPASPASTTVPPALDVPWTLAPQSRSGPLWRQPSCPHSRDPGGSAASLPGSLKGLRRSPGLATTPYRGPSTLLCLVELKKAAETKIMPEGYPGQSQSPACS